jgi:protein-tyrosine phosphatase
MPTVLILGAADTGRAPMAAALLRRLCEANGYGWAIASAGVLGHDDAEAETEARDTMVHMGLDIGEHRARSLDEAIVGHADVLVAIDAGTARVARARFPAAAARTFTLGELAGRARDIPDPFRMQIGAWMTYAREIDAMLGAALPRLAELLPAAVEAPLAPSEPGGVRVEQRAATERAETAARITQLLQVAAQMPGVVDWPAARARIEADLETIAALPVGSADLVAAYVGLLRAALALLPGAPSAGQLAAVGQAAVRLGDSIGQNALNDLSAQLATLPGLR